MNKVQPLESDHSAVSLVEVTKRHKTKRDKSEEGQRVCKICLEEEISQIEALENLTQKEIEGLQLIVPCECSGSMGYVHQKCIKTWIEKQLTNPDKKVECEICKSPLFFKMKKYKECDCQLKNLGLISCCNILTSIIELTLLIVVILVYQTTAGQYETNMLKYILISLMTILTISFGLTIMVMISQAFVKKGKTIGRIYTLEESIEMGLRQPKRLSAQNISTPSKKIKIKNKKIRKRNSEGNLFFDPILPNINNNNS